MSDILELLEAPHWEAIGDAGCIPEMVDRMLMAAQEIKRLRQEVADLQRQLGESP